MKPDRRLTPARPDLAARHLAGAVEAARFVDPVAHRVAAPTAPLRPTADAGAAWDTELLHGEDFAVYDIAGGWAWGQAALDGYVGYLPADALAPVDGPAGPPAPDHRVRTLWANLYARPMLKSPTQGVLPFGARVAVTETRDGFARIAPDRWVPDRWVPVQQVAPLAQAAPDWVAVAETFVGAPYLWGGRSPGGLDCSALVQLARQAAGHACQRNSDMQEAGAGRTLAEDAPRRRGDLVFWRGHVAVMIDPQTDGQADAARIVHANGHHMATVIEPLVDAVTRIAAVGGGPVTRRARLD